MRYQPLRHNLKGRRFGRLKVLSLLTEDGVGAGNDHKWLCCCDCGKNTAVATGQLRCGHTTSCGCYGIEAGRSAGLKRLRDLSGEKFGWLTAVEYITNDRSGTKRGRWLCVCRCGNETIASKIALLRGEKKSCGCMPKGPAKKRRTVAIVSKNGWVRCLFNPGSAIGTILKQMPQKDQKRRYDHA